MLTSDAVGAASLGVPVSEASFLVDPLATPLSAFFASAAAAVSLLVSFWSLSLKLSACLLPALRCLMAGKLVIWVLVDSAMLLIVWKPFVLLLSVTLVADFEELTLEELLDAVVSALLP